MAHLRHLVHHGLRLHCCCDHAHSNILNLLLAHASLRSRDALGFSLVLLNLSLVVFAAHVLRFNRPTDVLQHLLHLLHFLTHRLNLLLCGLQLRRLVAVLHQPGVNSLGKAFRHLLGTRPVHVLHKQVACHLPQLRVALQQLAHRIQRFLTLGCVAWPGGRHHIVLANTGVVDLVNHNALLVYDLLDRLGLHRVNLDHARFAVLTNNACNALCVVNLGD